MEELLTSREQLAIGAKLWVLNFFAFQGIRYFAAQWTNHRTEFLGELWFFITIATVMALFGQKRYLPKSVIERLRRPSDAS